jgi:hypothetical protein
MKVIIHTTNGDIVVINPYDFDKVLDDYEDKKQGTLRIDDMNGDIHVMYKENIIRIEFQNTTRI